jgi:hypothetical protein
MVNKGFLHFDKMSDTIWSVGMFGFTGVLDIFGAFVCPSQRCLAQSCDTTVIQTETMNSS